MADGVVEQMDIHSGGGDRVAGSDLLVAGEHRIWCDDQGLSSVEYFRGRFSGHHRAGVYRHSHLALVFYSEDATVIRAGVLFYQ